MKSNNPIQPMESPRRIDPVNALIWLFVLGSPGITGFAIWWFVS